MLEEADKDIDYYKQAIASRVEWGDDLQQALEMAYSAKKPNKCRPRALDAVVRLIEFEVDRNTILATLVSDMGLEDTLTDTDVRDRFGEDVLDEDERIDRAALDLTVTV